MTSAQICILLAIVAYLLAMLGVGVWFAKKNNSVDDFYLGGRKLGPFVTAMSAEASDMSGWLLMGLPGLAYWCGLADAAWTAIGLAVGTWLNWLIVAKRHIHMTPADAALFGVADKQNVSFRTFTARPLVFGDTEVRVSDKFTTVVHLDYDEANACGFRKGDRGMIVK